MCTSLITELQKVPIVRNIHSFLLLIFLSYNVIKTYSLSFLHIFKNMPYYFWMITWMKEANKFQKANVQPKCVRFCLFFSQPGLAYKKVCSSIEVLTDFINSRSSHRRCTIKKGVLKKFTASFLVKLQKTSERLFL